MINHEKEFVPQKEICECGLPCKITEYRSSGTINRFLTKEEVRKGYSHNYEGELLLNNNYLYNYLIGND